ncbi:uncharacterized protein LOC117103116 [Anneissia japonica]|uniref:uncharacterized protein LOC117103116 n=1 Tax=Anneissia japonica TaxID=1529436 RepID=UPI00142570FE|nr:uncharacterized protein LOC117103116 [Anneissia japonica]
MRVFSKMATALLTENYLLQRDTQWPCKGSHILAQYDDNSVVVYQAYNPEIASYAVENQRFGGPKFSFQRMSWVKTNFLWMMYRCGWASKANQQRVLAVWLKRSAFDNILSQAYTPKEQKKAELEEIFVRLQWDPDHNPHGEKEERRAIQLGLRGEVLQKYATEWIHKIEDVTAFVHEQKRILDSEKIENLITAKETVYPVTNPKTAQLIGVDI